MDGAEITGLAFYPLRYYPKEKKLEAITEVTFEFHLAHKKELVHPKIRSENAQKIYDAAMEEVVENDYDIPLYYLCPPSKPQREISQALPLPDCLIICPENQVATYEPLRLWLTQTGYPTAIYSIEDVYSI